MEEKIYTVYAPHDDITFIMLETEHSLTVKGFYYGEPNEEATKEFYGKLSCEFE